MFKTIYEHQNVTEKTPKKPVVYPESAVVLDPTCTLQQILNRAQYGVPIPQRDVSGDITSEELKILGLDATSLHTMNRMQLIDLRIRAQSRMQALQAAEIKRQTAANKKRMMDELRHQLAEETQV